jgi:hypothetical protein
MLKKQWLLVWVLAVVALVGCRGRSPYNEENKIRNLYSPDPTDINKEYKEWRSSFEEEAQLNRPDRRLYRRANFSFPATTQFRQTLGFQAVGSETSGKMFLTKQLRNGVVIQLTGTWEFTEASQTLTFRYLDTELKQNVVATFEVVTLVQDMLLLQAR